MAQIRETVPGKNPSFVLFGLLYMPNAADPPAVERHIYKRESIFRGLTVDFFHIIC